MDPISLAASIAGFLSLAIESYDTIASYIQDAKSAPAEAHELQSELSTLNQVLKQLVDFLRAEYRECPVFDEACVLYTVVAACQKQIQELFAKLEPLLSSKKRTRLLYQLRWPFKKEECIAITARLHQYCQTLGFSLTISNCKLLSQTSSSVLNALEQQHEQLRHIAALFPSKTEEMLEQLDAIRGLVEFVATSDVKLDAIVDGFSQIQIHQTEEKFNKLLSWLSPLEPHVRHHDLSSTRLKNSGEWFLESEEFKTWRHSDTTQAQPNVFWCDGIPGSRKTYLFSLLVDHLLKYDEPEKSIGVSFVYCAYKDKDTQNPVMILGALLKQLLVQLPVLPQWVQKLLERREVDEAKHRQPEIEDIKMWLAETCSSFDECYICIDALDEIENPVSRRALLVDVKHLPVNLFLTGRTHVDSTVRGVLQPQVSRQIRADENDIRKYVTQSIEQDPNPELMDDDLRDEIINTVCNNHQGMFLLPALQIKFVLEPRRKSRRRAALKHLPSALEGAYEALLERIRSQSPSSAQEAMDVLMWVSLCERGLTLQELCIALAIEVGSESLDFDEIPPASSVLNYCMGLVLVDEESGRVSLVHFSLQEYLKRHPGIFVEGHNEIGRVCLTYLNFTEIWTREPNNRLSLIRRPDLSHFLHYASLNWYYHVRHTANESWVPLAVNLFQDDEKLRALATFCFGRDYEMWQSYRYFFTLAESIGLHAAVVLGQVAIVRELLKEHHRKSRGQSELLLHFTTTPGGWLGGKLAIISLLLDTCNVTVDCRDEYGQTALHWACQSGSIEVARKLIDAGADIEIQDYNGSRPIHIVLRRGSDLYSTDQKSIFTELLKRDCVVTESNKYGETPLYLAAYFEDQEFVLALIERGALIDACDDRGRSALCIALTSLDEAALMSLVDAGARFSTDEEMDVLTGAKSVDERFDSMGDPCQLDEHGNSMLHRAAETGSLKVIEEPFHLGLDINAENRERQIPLHPADRNDLLNTVRLLLLRGAKTGIQDLKGATPLHVAASSGKLYRIPSSFFGQILGYLLS